MTLNKTHVAILRNLTLGSSCTAYGLSKQLKLEKALVENMVRQLEYVGFLRKADKDALKITENGQRALQCIAKNESYDHLLPNTQPENTAPALEDKTGLCTAEQSAFTADLPPLTVPSEELKNQVLYYLFKQGKSVGVSKTAGDLKQDNRLIKAALDHLTDAGHVKKYSGGNYYIKQSGRELVSQASTPPAQAVAQLQETETAEAQPTDSADDITDIDEALAELEQRGLVVQQGEYLSLPEHAILAGFNLDQMASEFEQEQSSQDHPVIDDISAKERALGYCSLLLSPHSTELKRAIEALQMDLAVIRLHQERRV